MQKIILNGYKAEIPGCTGILYLWTYDSYGCEFLQIIRGEGWEGLSVTATFVTYDDSVRVLVPEDGLLKVPPEATAKPAELSNAGKIVFKGLADGQRRITTDVNYLVSNHSLVDGNPSEDPTPSLTEQILAAAQKAIDTAESVRTDADAGSFNGKDGDPGGYYLPEVADGILSFTPSRSDMPAVDPQNVRGPQGETGPQGIQGETGPEGPQGPVGPTGATPTISIGTVTTLDPGEAADATITGPPENPVLNLWIPRGNQGKSIEGAPPILLTEGPAAVVQTDLAAEGYAMEPISSITFVQEGEGDPSPENIRPITGWDTINLTRCGKNLLDLSNAYMDGWNIVNIPNLLLPNKEYSYSVISSNVNLALFIASNIQTGKADKQLNLSESYLAEGSSVSFTTPALIEDKPYLILAGQTSGANLEEVKVQLEVSDVSDYEPYQGDDYTTNLPETIYGGTYNWATGELVVDRAMITLNGEEQKIQTWGVNAHADGLTGFYLYPQFEAYPFFDAKKRNEARCSHLPFSMVWGGYVTGLFLSTDTSQYFALTVPNIILSDISSDDNAISSFKEWLSSQISLENPVQISYLVKEPQTYHLSPQEILALSGTNTLFSDCGNTQVTFTADTKSYIDAKFTELAASVGLE